MGKIRVARLGDEDTEKELKRRADARREAKKSKKAVEIPDVRLEAVAHTHVSPDEKAADEEKLQKQKREKNASEIPPKTRSKRYKEAAGMVDKTKLYPLSEAVALVKKTSLTKFDGSVEVHININVNVLGEKKDVRGTVSLPHGTGKKVNVAIADDKIIAEIAEGKITFDILVASPAMMPKLAKVARVLGPKGLMPNPKNGTVTENPEKKAKELSAGQVNYKSEPENPIIHQTVGKVSFTETQLIENINIFLDSVGRAKISKATLTSTMGPGVKISIQ